MTEERKNEQEDTFLVTYLSPEFSEEGERTINECFREEMKKADRVEISVAYCAHNSLKELDRLVMKGHIKSICLILGTYFFTGFRESLHIVVMETHNKWQRMGVGEIRLTDSFKYHDKLYCFYKNDQIFSAIIGSPNLSFLTEKNKQQKPRQHEIGELIHKLSSLKQYQKYLKKLKSDRFSKNMTTLERYKVVEDAEEINKKGKIITKTKIRYTKHD